jgi:DNA-binding response OmpR family regulator
MEYSKKILIVEDEESIRKLLGIYAARCGLEADLASDGLIADTYVSVRESRDQSYPIILTDLKMPTLDGIELIANINEKVGRKEILKPEIYVLSGYHEAGFDGVKKLGVNKVYTKPTNMKTLFESVKESYDRFRSITQN